MTRKDIIIIAVLVNLGLLAILFITAMNNQDNGNSQDVAVTYNQPQVTPAPIPVVMEETHVQTFEPSPVLPIDEVDQSIREYFPETALPSEVTEDDSQITHDLPVATVPKKSPDSQDKIVEITIKQGDSLDKIARANGTSIAAIKALNKLTSDKLTVGKKLLIPQSAGNTKVAEAKPTPVKSTSSNQDPEYYTVKNGDNPWKIAKQFHVKFEDLLKMNNLDEEKARNLKAGDKLRVK